MTQFTNFGSDVSTLHNILEIDFFNELIPEI